MPMSRPPSLTLILKKGKKHLKTTLMLKKSLLLQKCYPLLEKHPKIALRDFVIKRRNNN
jgi:hypothetical protein